ncbi:24007_t:CDS:1, partial [Entrophospora sp. SA101]
KVLEKYQFLSNHNEPSTNLDEDESEDPVENIDENSASIEDEDLVENE